MNLELTEEQQLLQASVREFAEGVVRPRAAHIDQTGEFPRGTFASAGELGLAGVAVPAEHGGSGMDTVSYAIVIEEISRVCANMGVILSVNNSLVCDPIEKFGNADQKKRFLEPLARGEKLGCFALTEPDAGSDAGNQKTRAVREGDFYRISGQKVFITCGSDADVCLLFAMVHPEKKTRGISAFLVDANAPGFDRSRHQVKLGVNASGTVEIFLTDVKVPSPTGSARRATGSRSRWRPSTAAGSGSRRRRSGSRRRRSRPRSATRRRARPSASRSPTSRCSASTSPTWRPRSTRRVSSSDGRRRPRTRSKKNGGRYSMEAAIAKLYAAEMAQRVTTKALQIHGGYGYTKEYPVERNFRDARITEIYEGTSEIHRLIIAREIFRDSGLVIG